jgi:hypothetical protein
MRRNNRAFIRVDNRGILIPGSLIFRATLPKYGKWIEVDQNVCCTSTTTSTTTTTTTTSGV